MTNSLKPESNQPIIGFPEETERFSERHPLLLAKFDILASTLNKTFVRKLTLPSLTDRVVYFLGRLSAEDFWEIFLLCGNGYGIGALKLMRGLYERAVTAGYIARNPGEAERFWDYHNVQRGKHFNHVNKLFDMTKHFSAEKIQEIQSSYRDAKDRFQEPSCQTCKTTRTQFSWSRLDIGSMAMKSHEGLRELYLTCYFEPTMHAHATVTSLLARLLEGEEEAIRFDESAQHDRADEALIGAHNVILCVLGIQNDYFKLGFDDELQARMADFMEVWKA